VWHDTLSEPTKLVYCAVQPFFFVGSTYTLSVLVTLASDGVNDGVRGVQFGGCVGDFSCETCHVIMDDDMVFTLALFGMVCMVCWELLSSLASARAP
jgi:uncharacterized membrane protein YeiH